MEILWDSIKNCQQSLFRFEGLQDYSAEDGEEAVNYFIQTGQLKEIPDSNNEWWSDMKLRNEKGILTQRVRLIIEPKTDYTTMELEYLRMAKEYSGDDIRIIQQKDFEVFAPNKVSDFYLIDDQRLFIMVYGSQGKYLHSNESRDVSEYIKLKRLLLKSSVSL